MPTPIGTLPTHATSETFVAGPDIGEDTKVEPSAAEMAEGFHRTGKPPARKLNWSMNKLGEWVQYLAMLEPQNFFPAQNTHTAGTMGGLSGVFFAKKSKRYVAHTAAGDEVYVSFTGHRWVLRDSGDGLSLGAAITCGVDTSQIGRFLLFCASSASYYISSDSGESFTTGTVTGSGTRTVYAAVYDEFHAKTIAVGVNNSTEDSAWYSADGLTLTRVPLTAGTLFPSLIACDQATGRVVAAAVLGDRIWYSEDGGVTWGSYVHTFDNHTDLTFNQETSRWVLTTNDGEVLFATDPRTAGGWTEVTEPEVPLLAIAAAGRNYVGITGVVGGLVPYFFFSQDEGETWQGHPRDDNTDRYVRHMDGRFVIFGSQGIAMGVLRSSAELGS